MYISQLIDTVVIVYLMKFLLFILYFFSIIVLKFFYEPYITNNLEGASLEIMNNIIKLFNCKYNID